MSSRRDDILRELGLTPLWRLRESPDTAPATAVPASPPAQQDAPRSDRGGPASLVPADERTARILRLDWAALKAAVAGCTDCKLAQGRNKTVFGVGDERAQWLFVGEGSGADEDAQGEPFVGQAGVGYRFKSCAAHHFYQMSKSGGIGIFSF